MERRISDGNENLPEITESENKQEMEEEDEYMEELASGKTVYEENETQEEESEGSQEGTTSGGEDVENESSAMILENEEVTEEDQNPEETEEMPEEESEEESGENKNPDVEPEPVTCVVYVSEYFSPETTSLPENVQTQQIPVKRKISMRNLFCCRFRCLCGKNTDIRWKKPVICWCRMNRCRKTVMVREQLFW